jgi:HK97 family phage portal protein
LGFFARLFNRRSAPPVPPATFTASSGFTFSDLRKNSTVTACVNVIANAISILPLNLFFRNNDGSRSRAYSHQAYKLLRQRPNPSESPTIFISKLVRHIKEKGNAYVYKNKAGGDVISLHLLSPENVTEVYDGMKVFYRYGGETYDSETIIHISSLITDDRGHGYADVDLAKTAVLLASQFDYYALNAFGNGLNTKLLIDITEEVKAQGMDEEGAAKYARTISDFIAAHYTGYENAGKPLINFSGKVVELKNQSSNREAELLESRKWSELEVCKIMGVPPFIVNGSYDVKYGNLESAMTVFLNFGLSPLLRHIEQRLAYGLLTAKEQERFYFEFDYNVLLRPDEKSRAEFYSKLFSMGAISPGQICAKENLEPPPEGADSRFFPANMAPLRTDVLEAYMAKSKSVAAGLVNEPTDPARSAGDDKL